MQTKAGVRCSCNGFCRAHERKGTNAKVWREDGVNMGSQQKRHHVRITLVRKSAALHTMQSKRCLAMLTVAIQTLQKHGKQAKHSIP